MVMYKFLWKTVAALFLPVCILSTGDDANAQSLKNVSIRGDGNIVVYTYAGIPHVLELDIFKTSYVSADGKSLVMYNRKGKSRTIKFGEKIIESNREYTLSLKGDTMLFKGKMLQAFNFRFRVKLKPKGDMCRITKNIVYGDPDITHKFDGYYRNGYSCSIAKGNIFN